MSHHSPDSPHPHPPPMDHDAHHDAHIHGLRLALGSLLTPKRPSLPSHTGSYSASGTASPFHHWHHPGTVTVSVGTGPDTPPLPPPPPHPTPVGSLHQPHHQLPYHHAHQPTPSPHAHLNSHYHGHAHPQPQSHTHPHAFGPSRLSFTRSTSSTPPESLSPSPTPSPRVATPPLTIVHAPHAYQEEPAAGDSPATKMAAGSTLEAADAAKRAHFLTTLQSKSAWDAMVHGSWV
ncbi:hypothetical protein F5148DRAFT_447553 [Russula earlei]|uniref:Uncharacterized protein n=1 Tax=Russula earlei TaxID=71964 RepID=A0ACC0U141_9AGAM|nr:hypothetical protein F5148DRAFT_447553 [Russula earlei]